MRPGEAVMELSRFGFHFRLEGKAIKVRYEGKGIQDPSQVAPLLSLVRQHKDQVGEFLRCYCPKCGGVIFCPDLEGVSRCLACEWDYLATIYPGLNQRH
jgi:hypothetical protein